VLSLSTADWQQKLGKGLGLTVVELSGDVTPDLDILQKADLIITTPEKWDGTLRNDQIRSDQIRYHRLAFKLLIIISKILCF